MNCPGIQRAIRANNRLWAGLYYDELVDTPHYQISFMMGADAGYYCAGQALSTSDPAALDAIESFFRARGIVSAIYTDPQSPPDLPAILEQRGYVRVPAEDENCHGLDLAELARTEPSVRLDGQDVRIEAVGGPDDPLLDAFVDVDGSTNELSPAIREKLAARLRGAPPEGVSIRCYVALIGVEVVSTRLVGRCGDFALLAEGGTLPAFRRRGLYSTLVRHSLVHARQEGARYAYQTAGLSSASNQAMLALGFERLATRAYYARQVRSGNADRPL